MDPVLRTRLRAIAEMAFTCANDDGDNHERIVALEIALQCAQTAIQNYKRRRVQTLPPEVTALVIRFLDPFSALGSAALCGDRATYDAAFEMAFGTSRKRFYASCDANGAWIRHEIGAHLSPQIALVLYGVAWGTPDLDEIVNMECDTQRIIVIAIKEYDGSKDARVPSIKSNRFDWLCIGRCVMCARQRESPFLNGSTLNIMGDRPIWWVERAPCAVRRIRG